MNPLKPRGELEADIVRELRAVLEAAGWLVEKTHGSLYAAGWPDLFIAHPAYGMRWVEVKRPHVGKLEPSQVKRFNRWAKHGVGVYILLGSSKGEIEKLFHAPNWYAWVDRSYRAASQPRKKT